jgi:hypothetical protein
MNAIADKYAVQKVGSIFLYTNEAHPGENYPHHTSFAQKLKHAQALRDILNVARPILADALDGSCHLAYGSMPNMTWIFNKAGIPIYKSDWTDAESVENALIYFLNVAQRRRERERLAPFRVERLDYRKSNREEFYAGLELSGPKAVREFKESGF